jgi:hypothetical protein
MLYFSVWSRREKVEENNIQKKATEVFVVVINSSGLISVLGFK